MCVCVCVCVNSSASPFLFPVGQYVPCYSTICSLNDVLLGRSNDIYLAKGVYIVESVLVLKKLHAVKEICIGRSI